MIEISEFVLDTIANGVQPLQNEKFIHVEYREHGVPREAWVYPEPVRRSTSSDFGGGIYKSNLGDEAFVNLNFPEQLLLQNRVKGKLGVDLRHGSLKENFIAAHFKKTKEYFEKVLDKYSVYTGEIARKDESARRVTKIRILNKRIPAVTQQILRDEDGIELPPMSLPKEIEQINYLSSNLKTRLPRGIGFCRDLRVIPTDKDLKTEKLRNGLHWTGTHYDGELFSAVWCQRDPEYNDTVLMAGSEEPMKKYPTRVIPIWTGENPKK